MAKFLITGEEGLGTSLAWQLQYFDGHDVRVFWPKGKELLLNMIEHVNTLEEGLKWVGKDGYIISEDEADMTPLRKRGYKVYGGNKFTDRLENDRVFELDVCKKAGIRMTDYHAIKSVKEGISFIEKNPKKWALKQLGHLPKTWSYIGKHDDGSDVIDQLEWIAKQPEIAKLTEALFILQETIEGMELGVGAFWMYDDWLRDAKGSIVVELNREHKKEMDGDIGLTTGELGTVARFSTSEYKLFNETLKLLEPMLKANASDVCLDIDANCGITDDGKAYLFETTPRNGYPISSLHEYLIGQKMDVGEFYISLIEGEQGNFEYDDKWGVVTVLGSGTFPLEINSHQGSFKDQPVDIPQCEDQWDSHIHPLFLKYDPDKSFYRIAAWYEMPLCVTYSDEHISLANQKCVEAMKKIDTRAPKYRSDIGRKFVTEELPRLVEMGFIKEAPDAHSWIGVDLDQSLAHYVEWGDGTIGKAIPKMLERVKEWLKDGKMVKILTSRAGSDREIRKIKKWLMFNGLPELEVTNQKDHNLIELWDDRAVSLIPNTGEINTNPKSQVYNEEKAA